jgi:hypothetical protein
MQKQGAVNYVEGARPEGHLERIRRHPRRLGAVQVMKPVVERCHCRSREYFPDDCTHVARSSPDVEHREAVVVPKQWLQSPPQNPMASQVAINADEVTKAALGGPGRLLVQNLVADYPNHVSELYRFAGFLRVREWC